MLLYKKSRFPRSKIKDFLSTNLINIRAITISLLECMRVPDSSSKCSNRAMTTNMKTDS